VNWNQANLERLYNINKSNKTVKTPTIVKSGKWKRVISLLFVYLMTVTLMGFFPLELVFNGISTFFPNLTLYLLVFFISIYIYWLLHRLHNRYEKNRKKNPESSFSLKEIWNSLAIADFIPLVIAFSMYHAFVLKKDPDFKNSPLINPLTVLGNPSENNSLYSSEFLSLLTGITGILLIFCLSTVFIYYIWIFSEIEFQKLYRYTTDRKIIIQTNKEQKTPIDLLPRRKLKGITYKGKVVSFTPDIELSKIWRLLNPFFVRDLLLGSIFGLLMFQFGLIYLNLFLISPEFLSELEILNLLASVGLVISSLFWGYYIIKRFIIFPLWDYYSMKKYLIKAFTRKRKIIYQSEPDNNFGNQEIAEILFLQSYIDSLKNSPIIPLPKSLMPLIFFIPVVGQFIALLSILQL